MNRNRHIFYDFLILCMHISLHTSQIIRFMLSLLSAKRYEKYFHSLQYVMLVKQDCL